MGSWTEVPEPGDSKTSKEATIKVQATGEAERGGFGGRLGGRPPHSQPLVTQRWEEEAQKRSRLGWGGCLECTHSIHTQHQPPLLQQGHYPTSPRGSSGAVAPPVQLPTAHQAPAPTASPRLIPLARLMNNVIKGAITLFLNAF